MSSPLPKKIKLLFQLCTLGFFSESIFPLFFHAFSLLPLVKSDFSDECHPELYCNVSSIREMLQKDEQNVFRSSKLNGLTWSGEWRGRTSRVLVLLMLKSLYNLLQLSVLNLLPLNNCMIKYLLV